MDLGQSLTVKMIFTRLQNYTNVMVGKHGIQTFKVMVVVLLLFLSSFDVFVLTDAHPLLILGMWFVQIYLTSIQINI